MLLLINDMILSFTYFFYTLKSNSTKYDNVLIIIYYFPSRYTIPIIVYNYIIKILKLILYISNL